MPRENADMGMREEMKGNQQQAGNTLPCKFYTSPTSLFLHIFLTDVNVVYYSRVLLNAVFIDATFFVLILSTEEPLKQFIHSFLYFVRFFYARYLGHPHQWGSGGIEIYRINYDAQSCWSLC